MPLLTRSKEPWPEAASLNEACLCQASKGYNVGSIPPRFLGKMTGLLKHQTKLK